MTKENYKQQYLKIGICILIGILIKLLVPVCYDLTPKGVTYLAIFIPTILLWTFVDTGWPSIICMAMFALCQVMPTSQVTATTIANTTVMTVITAGVLVGKLHEYGVLRYLAKWFISRKAIHNRPYVFLLFWCLLLFVNGAILGTIIGFVILIPVLRAVCEEIDCPKGSSFHKAMFLLTIWVGIFTEACIIFFMPTPLTGLGVLNGMGFAWGLFDYMKVASIPVFVISIVVAIAIVKFIVKPDVSNFWKYDDAAKRAELKANPICIEGKICTGLLILQIFFSGIAGSLGLGAFSTWAAAVGMCGFTFLFVGSMNLIFVNGKPLMNVAEDGKYIPWKAMIFVSVTFLFSSSISSADYGIVSTLMQIIAPVASKLPTMALIIIGAVLCVFLTNLISNVVTCFITLSVFIPVLSAVGVNPALVQATAALYIALCSLACAAPSGSPGIGLIMGVEIENKGLFKYTIIYLLVMIVLLMATILPIGSLLYK